MKIKSKLERTKKINELKPNKFSEQIFNQGRNKEFENLKKYPTHYYATRDKSNRGI